MRYTFLARSGTGTTGTAKYRVAWPGVVPWVSSW